MEDFKNKKFEKDIKSFQKRKRKKKQQYGRELYKNLPKDE